MIIHGVKCLGAVERRLSGPRLSGLFSPILIFFFFLMNID